MKRPTTGRSRQPIAGRPPISGGLTRWGNRQRRPATVIAVEHSRGSSLTPSSPQLTAKLLEALGNVWVPDVGGAIGFESPRCTRYQVWNKQCRDKVLIDVHDVGLGHQTRMRWNDPSEWAWSEESRTQGSSGIS